MAAADLLAALPDASVGVVVTDPPWDLAGGGRFDACASYPRMPVRECARVLQDAQRVLLPGGHLYLWAPAGAELGVVFDAMRGAGWRFVRALAWHKGGGRGLGAWRNVWEPLLIWSNGPSRGFNLQCEIPSLLRAAVREGRTVKPWTAYRAALLMSLRPGELAVDPFCGSNPLRAAAESVGAAWLAGDVATPEQVEADMARRTWEKAGGTGAAARERRETAASASASLQDWAVEP